MKALAGMSGLLIASLPILGGQVAPGQEVGGDAPASREEHEKLRREVEALRSELEAVKAERDRHVEETDASFEEVEETVTAVRKDAEARAAGTTSFLLSGNSTISYIDREHENSTFSVVFRPVFLWRFSDRLFFEAKPEIRLRQGTEEVSLTLEYADASYIVNDYLTVGAGKFLTPFGLFPDRFYPGKLLDEPLIFARGDTAIAPRTDVGAFARGAFPVGPYEFNYAAWVGNGPGLRTAELDSGGLVDFNGNFRDNNDNKTVGGRVGFLPLPALELGYSFLYGQVAPDGLPDTTVVAHGVDLQYFDTVEPLRGQIDFRGEWVWLDVDDVTLDPAGSMGFSPLESGGRRNGGYLELGYRPSLVDDPFIKNLELVTRWDLLDGRSRSAGSADEQRLTTAVLYWLTPTTSLRAGYVFSDREDRPDNDTFFLQMSVGF